MVMKILWDMRIQSTKNTGFIDIYDMYGFISLFLWIASL